MQKSAPKSAITVRDLESVDDLQLALKLEQEVWNCSDLDVTPLVLAVAAKAAGGLWVGAFDGSDLVGFAFAFPSLEHGRVGLHSHTLAVKESYRTSGLGYTLKIEQRNRALAMGITEISWTFDPLRSPNAHLNFNKLGVVSHIYKADFYGSQSSSPLHTNSTDRLWVQWQLTDARVEQRLKGRDYRSEVLDKLAHLEPLVRFNGNGEPAEGDLPQALSRQRIAIEIPGDMDRIEGTDRERARRWRLATRQAFTEALAAGFVVKEFCRSVRGQQGPGAYLLEKEEPLQVGLS